MDTGIGGVQVVTNVTGVKKIEDRGLYRSPAGATRQDVIPEAHEDTVSLHHKAGQVPTYACPATARQQTDSRFLSLRSLVAKMLEDQGAALAVQGADKTETIDISQLTPEKAQALVAEDGYFGVEKTSGRILDFAIAMAGNDPARIDVIKDAVNKGFEMAKEALGGSLPEICVKTYEAAMEKIDAWVQGFA